MKKKPVAIDLNIVIDPYKLLGIIQDVDKIYSEIVIPEPLSYIEIWHPKWRMYTFNLFRDKTILDADLETFFGFDDIISENNFVSGMKLLIMAYNKGMVRIIDMEQSSKYEKVGRELLGVNGNFNNIEKLKLKNGDLFINPDLPISEMLYGMQEDNIISIYGNSDFLNYWNNGNKAVLGQFDKTNYSSSIDKRLKTLIFEEKFKDLYEIFRYVETNNRIKKLDIEFQNTIYNYEKKKDLFFLTLEFVSTATIDMFIGLPVTAGALFAYQFTRRLISKNN